MLILILLSTWAAFVMQTCRFEGELKVSMASVTGAVFVYEYRSLLPLGKSTVTFNNVIYCRVYCIELSLYYGDSKISPVGMFSAPSTMESFVADLPVRFILFLYYSFVCTVQYRTYIGMLSFSFVLRPLIYFTVLYLTVFFLTILSHRSLRLRVCWKSLMGVTMAKPLFLPAPLSLGTAMKCTN